jgi:3',5'-cyclic AMP phosphodiesterase CpdA
LHHPPVPGTVKRRASLRDGDDFAAAIARSGAELILHGHTHRMSHQELSTPCGPVPVIGVASASARTRQAHREPAQFHLYSLTRKSGRWALDLEIRALESAALGFGTLRKLSIPVPA